MPAPNKPAPPRYFAVWKPVSTRMSADPQSPDYERFIDFGPQQAFHTGEVPAHLASEYPYLLANGHLTEISRSDFELIRANPPLLNTPEPANKEGQDG